jgi:hypothetical protein
MISLDKEHYTHLLLIYIDISKKQITIICATTKQMINIVKKIGNKAFKCAPGTNNRGVEYSKELISEIIKNNYFRIDIKNVSIIDGIDPIKRRRNLINLLT